MLFFIYGLKYVYSNCGKFKFSLGIIYIINIKNAILECSNIAFSKEYDITKINIALNDVKTGILKVKVEEEGHEYETIFLDNKDEEINENSFPDGMK